MTLRNRKNRTTMQKGKRKRTGSGEARQNTTYSPGDVPRVYYKKGGNNTRANIKQYEYYGNF